VLTFRVNDEVIDYHPDPAVHTQLTWVEELFPEQRITIGLPPGALLPGRNRIQVSTAPLPGLKRWAGAAADDLELELE
jgi:hypothetical protein